MGYVASEDRAIVTDSELSDADIILVFNGEIYNFVSLREELSREYGYRFFSGSDTEVLLKAYHAYGRSCLDRLNGMFAFAIYDRRENIIFAARDRL